MLIYHHCASPILLSHLYLHLSAPPIAEVLAEEAAVRKKADEVRAKKEAIEMARGITLEDLTKGLLNYRFTGLTFERSDKGALRCVSRFDFCLLGLSSAVSIRPYLCSR